jgi:phosphoglycolate phosphatase-like HAD superfamily hydrolase
VEDIQSARAASAHAVAVTWGADDAAALRAAGAEKVFDIVAELHTFLDELTAKVQDATEEE